MIEVITSNVKMQVGKIYTAFLKDTGKPVKAMIMEEATKEEYLNSDVKEKFPLEFFYKVSFD